MRGVALVGIGIGLALVGCGKEEAPPDAGAIAKKQPPTLRKCGTKTPTPEQMAAVERDMRFRYELAKKGGNGGGGGGGGGGGNGGGGNGGGGGGGHGHGRPDAGVTPDASIPADAFIPADAPLPVQPDAWIPPDAPLPPDAFIPADAPLPPDAYVVDAGPPPMTRVTIPVFVHHVYGSAPRVTQSQIEAQIAALNHAFRDSPQSVVTRFDFVLRGTSFVNNPAWATAEPDTSDEHNMKVALRRTSSAADPGVPPEGILNLYMTEPGGGLLGWATFPWWYSDDPVLDGVVIHAESVPGGSAAPYDQGDSAVHEVGHWLGLWHTFQGGCSGISQLLSGTMNNDDRVADTPRVRSPTFGCPAPQTANSCIVYIDEEQQIEDGFDMVENFMDYTDDACMWRFTQGQSTRMHVASYLYRSMVTPDPLPEYDL